MISVYDKFIALYINFRTEVEKKVGILACYQI